MTKRTKPKSAQMKNKNEIRFLAFDVKNKKFFDPTVIFDPLIKNREYAKYLHYPLVTDREGGEYFKKNDVVLTPFYEDGRSKRAILVSTEDVKILNYEYSISTDDNKKKLIKKKIQRAEIIRDLLCDLFMCRRLSSSS